MNVLLPENISKNKIFENIPREVNVTGTNYAINVPATTTIRESQKQFALVTSVILTNKTLRSIPIYAKVSNDVDGNTAMILYGVNLPPGTAFEIIQGNKFILKENDKLFLYHTDTSENVVDALVSYVVHKPEAEFTA
tara:strand:- start:1573 stop:1983 length:411 start_codon:yes stop_codon:yes gene_type:complete